jgi:hypothetical protein
MKSTLNLTTKFIHTMKFLKQVILSALLVFLAVATNAQNTQMIKRGGVLTDTMHTNRLVSTGATNGQLLQFNGTNWVPATVTATTDLTIANRTTTTLDVNSSNGNDATVPAATNLLAGLMIAADKAKSDFITITQAVDLDALEAASHAAVTITDGTTVNLTLAAQNLTAEVIESALTAANIPLADTGNFFTTDNINAAFQQLGATSHAAVTVTDGTKIDFTLTGQNLTATIIAGSIANTDLAQSGATTNQVLSWSGTNWVPVTQSATNTSATATAPLTATTVQGQLNELATNTHAAATVTDNARIDFTLTGQNITADLAQNSATTGQVMTWSGTAWAPAANRSMREESFTATAAQTAFTIAVSQSAVSGTSVPVRVFRNGVRLFYAASGPNVIQFTYSGTTITTTANAVGDIITVEYLN